MKNIILNTLLVFCAVPIWAVEYNEEDKIATPDSMSLGFHMSVDKDLNAMSAVGAGSETLERALDIDLYKSLYGKIAGLNVSQSGALTLHGRTPLVLIDGFPRSISDVTPFEVESITILKDAVAASLYGVRGANGVVLIETKRAGVQPLSVTVDYQFGVGVQYKTPEFADSYTYATHLNSALISDNLTPKYSDLELDAFKNNTHPYEYPNVDWWGEIYNDTALNHRLRMSFVGGTDRFKYYSTIDYMHDTSFFKSQTDDDRYDTSPTDVRLRARSNMDVAITPTTLLTIGITADLNEINRANTANDTIAGLVYDTPSAAFPVKYRDGVYGGNATYQDNNPVAKLFSTGSNRWTYMGMLSNINLHQNLDKVVRGLSADVAVAFDYWGFMSDTKSKTYQYVDPSASILSDGTMVTTPVYYGSDSATLSNSSAFQNIILYTNLQAKVNYEYAKDDHDFITSLIFHQDATNNVARNASIRRQSVILYANYAYKERYIMGVSGSYSGSAYLEPGSQYDLYPAVNAAWLMSKESFMSGVSFVDSLKIFGSYGVSGSDSTLSHELWRTYYGSTGANSYVFGTGSTALAGKTEGSLPIGNLSVPKVVKATFGVDAQLFGDRLNIYAEAFHERSCDILMDSSTSVSSTIGVGVGDSNIGEYVYRGVDFATAWSDNKGDFSYGAFVNLSYLNSEIIKNNQAYQKYDYLYKTGDRVGQAYGLECVGFFEDQTEINNSAVHSFQSVQPGDLKYKDQNGDNKIDSEDVIKMFDSTSLPALYFGFGFNVGYKGFELAADFQGVSGLTVNTLNIPLYQPLVDNGNISQTVLDNEIFWTPENHNKATMPRLTTLENSNNYRNSSHWYKDGSFLKLRSLYLAYTIPKKVLHFASAKVYVQGNNLFSIDNLDIVDPEAIGSTSVLSQDYYLGVKLNF